VAPSIGPGPRYGVRSIHNDRVVDRGGTGGSGAFMAKRLPGWWGGCGTIKRFCTVQDARKQPFQPLAQV